MRNDETVRHAAGLEGGTPERAHLDGAIGQFVVIGRHIPAKSARIDPDRFKTCGQFPMLGRWFNGNVLRLAGLPQYHEAQAGRVEEAPVGIEPGGSHRGIVRLHLIGNVQGLARRAINLPAVLVDLLHGTGLSALPCLQRQQFPRKLADQIAARNPCRQGKLLAFCRAGDAQRDLKQMGMHIRG